MTSSYAKPRQESRSKSRSLLETEQLLMTTPSDPHDPDSIDSCSSQVLGRRISHRRHEMW